MDTWFKLWFSLGNLMQWYGAMARDRLRKLQEPIHIIFCMVDHYEPGAGGVSFSEERARVNLLLSTYPKLANAHQDRDNCRPKRTWFFPPHYHRNGNLKDLVSLCEQGYGEIELHLHHGKTMPDTEMNLRETIAQTIKEYSEFGIFGTENGNKRYGFIHGDWALDNSIRNRFCGVNSEITVLKDTGCYADFTFPSMNEANPRKVNSLFYATDDPKKPKSYTNGRNVQRLGTSRGDLMIVEGPMHPYFVKPGITGLRVIGDSVDEGLGITEKRINMWVKTGIHVQGKRNWVFVKVHTHGATDAAVVLGKQMDEAFSHLEEHYDDGARYALHYVTARELYNIVKAVEAGETCDNPGMYREFRIAPPSYNTKTGTLEASELLRSLIARTYKD